MTKRTFRQLELMLHFLTAAILLLKGYDLIGKNLYYPGSIILALAMMVLGINLFWKLMRMRPKQARIVCYYLESPALLVTAYVLYLEHREFLPDVFLLAAILYPAVGFISSKKFKRIRKQGL